MPQHPGDGHLSGPASVLLAHGAEPVVVLDDQGALRKHLSVFIDGQPIRDRQRLSDVLGDASRVYVVQALTGG